MRKMNIKKVTPMNHKTFLLFFVFLYFATVALALSSQGEKDSKATNNLCSFVIDKLQERYDSTTDISAYFDQETRIPGDPEPIKASGRVFFKRPYLMRWDYERPEKQLIVTSGSNVYVYEKEAGQVSILSRKQFLSTRISRAFFFGKGDIRRDFKVIGCMLTKEGWVLKLEPKEPIPQLKRLKLTLDKNDFLVKKTEIEDQMGSTTLIVFKEIKVNQNIPRKLFHFIPPKDVEIFTAG